MSGTPAQALYWFYHVKHKLRLSIDIEKGMQM